ncbi:MAG: hypothetical protein HUU50_05500 [Candidatus Brocadiae bacterium]|nr:hypothetical protein [Candidatus Brocadiia bacterium]
MMQEDKSKESAYLPFLPLLFQRGTADKDSFFINYLKIFERIWNGRQDNALRGYMFSIKEEYAASLNQESLPEEIQKKFDQCAHRLSKNATVKSKIEGKEWQIYDHEQRYFAYKEESQIHFYREGQKGIIESLEILSELFHPRFSFLFPESENTFIPPLEKTSEREFARYFPLRIPFESWLEEFLSWLAGWMALSLQEHWSIQKKREVISKIIPLYRMRGTRRGLEKYLKIYTGEQVVITEPLSAFQLEKNSVVGGDSAIEGSPYFFIVDLKLPRMAASDMKMTIRTVEKIIDTEKPAHTVYKLNVISPTVHIGEEGTTIEKDTILGEE